MKLALGTVQFGLEYGVANSLGKVTKPVAAHILDVAKLNRIDLIDTAIGYGDSELVLGRCGVSAFDIVSKLPKIPNACNDIVAWTLDEIRHSLSRLRVKSLHALLLHHPADLLEEHGNDLAKALIEAKTKGLIEKFGFSIYDPSSLHDYISVIRPDIVQAPLNVVDRRLFNSGWLKRLVELDIEVHARSLFLQGLLLLSPAQMPNQFHLWRDVWLSWEQYLFSTNQSAVEACLNYVTSVPGVDRMVVGVQSAGQLKEIIPVVKHKPSSYIDPTFMQTEDASLIDPSRW